MKVQPCQNFSYYNNQNELNKNIKKENSPSFGSICADANAKNQYDYAIHAMLNPYFSQLKCSSTRIFRELSSELAISRLLNPDEKSEIKILGSSDGSEAWAYAIAVKETMKQKAKNVNIEGIDIAPYMTELSKTDCLVLSNIERKYAEGTIPLSMDESPLKGRGWSKYLKPAKRPEKFNEIANRYPCVKFLENDPAVGKSIGNGLSWWKINKEGLPDVKFKCADMRNSFKPNENVDNEVYVLANSAGYLIESNPEDFIKLLKNIKDQNKDKKDTYIVFGSLETGYVLDRNPKIAKTVDKLGFKNVPEENLKKLKIKGYKEASRKIYKLQKS